MAKSTTPAPKARARPVDITLLSDETKVKLRKEAKVKVEAERLLEAEEAFLAEATLEEKRRGGEEEEMVQIVMDLPLFADRLVLDGIHYFHGRLYTVPLGRFNVMREQQQRMWGHQNEIDGKRSDPRRPLDRVMNRHGMVNTSGLARA